MLLLQDLELLLVVLRVHGVGCKLCRGWLGVATTGTDAGALAEALRRMLGELLLRLVLLAAVVVELMVLALAFEAGGPSLSIHALQTSAAAAAVDLGRRVGLHVSRHAWVEELGILGLQRMLRAGSMIRCRTHVGHLLLIHGEVLLVEVLHPRLVIVGLDHLLDAT